MSKKNTITIAILGLLTLVVTVIGASFAYFNIQTNAEYETTYVKNQSANATGAVVFTTITDSLHFKIDDSEMSLDNIGNKYYATDNPLKDYALESEVHTFTLAQAKVQGGDKSFKCYYDFTVSLNENTTMIPNVKGDVVLNFSGDSKITENGSIDIKDLLDSKKVNFKGYFEKLDPSTNSVKNIKMELYVRNSEENQIAYIANKDLSLKIEPKEATNGFYCEPIV